MCVDTSMTQWGDNQPLQGWGSFKAPWPLRGGAERNSSRYHMDNLSAPIQSKLLGVASWATLMTMQFFSHLLSLHSYCFNKEPMKWANTWSRKGQVTRFTSGSSLNVTGKLMRLKWDHLRSFEIIGDYLRSCGQCFPVVFVPAPRRWCAATRMAPSGACHHPAASRTDISHPHGDHSVSWYHQYDQYGQYDQYNKYLQDPSSVNHMTSNSPGIILRIALVWAHNRIFVSVVCRSTPCIICASFMFASRFPSVVTQQYTHCYAHLHHQPQNGCKTN